MTSVIRIMCWADGRPSALDGRYLVDWSQSADGKLDVATDSDPRRARQYPDAPAALRAWREQSTERPLRPWDGKPNRPLTALTVEILDLEKVLDDLS